MKNSYDFRGAKELLKRNYCVGDERKIKPNVNAFLKDLGELGKLYDESVGGGQEAIDAVVEQAEIYVQHKNLNIRGVREVINSVKVKIKYRGRPPEIEKLEEIAYNSFPSKVGTPLPRTEVDGYWPSSNTNKPIGV